MRECRPATRIGTTGRGIGPAYEDKVGRRAIRLMDLADLQRSTPRSSGCSRITTRCAAGSRSSEIERAAIHDELAAHRAASAAVHGFGLVAARRRSAARASASCSRARRARCSTSTTAPIRS